MYGVSNSVSPLSSSWVESLVQQTMVFERQPLTRLEQQRDSLTIRKSIYNDISSKITALQTSIEALKGISSAFNSKAVFVTDNNSQKVVNASLNGKPVSAEYALKVTHLAQAHQIGSARQAQNDVALGLTGNFIIGGAANRNITNSSGANNPVAGFGVGTAIQDGELELGTGSYSVEFRQAEGVWQFRVVNENGDAVRIRDASDNSNTTTTSNWQNFALVQADDGQTKEFDTGRGLTITFNDGDTIEQQLYGDTDIASISYTAQGVTVNVEATDSLNNIRDKIRNPENNLKYAEGNEVQATVVDRRLILTSSRTGLAGTIKLFEGTGNILNNLGISVDGSGHLTNTEANELRAAQDAEFSINNVNITRNRNIGLTDVIQSLSLDLTAEGEAIINVKDDNGKVTEKFQSFTKNINDLRTYLKAKTEAIRGKDSQSGNPTYTSAPLGQDFSMRQLRQDMASILLGKYNEAVGDTPKYLSDIGITLNSEGSFELSDTNKLTLALKNNFIGVQDLANNILGNLENRLTMYTGSSNAILKSKKSALDDELKQINERITNTNKLLAKREDALRTQYMSVQSQLISMTYQFQSMQAIATGGGYNGQI